MAQEAECLTRKVRECSMRLTVEDRYSGLKIFEFKRIAHETYENLVDVLAKIGADHEETITVDDIRGCHGVLNWKTLLTQMRVMLWNSLQL